MLSKNQIDTFKQDGALVLADFFSEQEIDEWRAHTYDFYRKPQSNEEWMNAILNIKSSNMELKTFPTPHSHHKMVSLYKRLHNDMTWEGHNELIPRWPEPQSPWLGARSPHLDFPIYDHIRTLANSVFYLNDVSDKGGPLMYWKGSHLTVWKYFQQNPIDYLAQGNLSQGQVFNRILAMMDNEPVAFSGKAGDLLIWHSLLLHSPSVNNSHSPRLAIFGRWGKQLKPAEIHYKFIDEEPWDYWGFS